MADATFEAKQNANTTERVLKLKAACKTHPEQVDERSLWTHEKVKPTVVSLIQEEVPQLLEARTAGIEPALAETIQFVQESRDVLNNSDKVAGEVEPVKGELFKHITDKRAKFALHTARAPGLPAEGVAGAVGVQSVEAAAGTPSQVAFDNLYAQVLLLSTKRRCDHVGVNAARIMALETDAQRPSITDGTHARILKQKKEKCAVKGRQSQFNIENTKRRQCNIQKGRDATINREAFMQSPASTHVPPDKKHARQRTKKRKRRR